MGLMGGIYFLTSKVVGTWKALPGWVTKAGISTTFLKNFQIMDCQVLVHGNGVNENLISAWT